MTPTADPESMALAAHSVSSAVSRLAAMPLHRRFALVGSAVTLAGMMVIGTWVSRQIETGVTRNSAISSALFMESYLAPLSQELATSEMFSAQTIERLHSLFAHPPLSDEIVAAKIWREGGLLAFSSEADMIGQRFEPGEALRRAWEGELTASFDDLHDEENARERETGVPLLEIYNPIHSIVTGEIIAVAEFYQDATELRSDLRTARTKSWAVVAAVTLATFAALYGIVRNGGLTIARQHVALTRQLREVARVSAQNETLRHRVQAASRRASETNERQLRRISADLHDGPAQALALASLRFDALMHRANLGSGDGEAAELRRTLDDAMREIRDLCRGLSLPELDGRCIPETLEMAIAAHERRTGSTVLRRFAPAATHDRPAPHPVLICVYRFVQEGLMNAFRHAGGAGVAVTSETDGRRLVVSVSDAGPGFDPVDACTRSCGLGLSGLKERVESIGGEFSIGSAAGSGTLITLTLPLEAQA
jgi:signal transduction histidine kinase